MRKAFVLEAGAAHVMHDVRLPEYRTYEDEVVEAEEKL